MSSKEAIQLPLAKVKTIMKSSPDVESIGLDAVYLMSKAAELFVTYLTARAYNKGESQNIDYSHLANVVNSDDDDVYGFLQEIIPRKITVKEYYELIKQEENTTAEGSSDD